VLPVTTNIIIFEVSEGTDAKKIVAALNDLNIRCLTTSPTHIRMVFHLDIKADDIQAINNAIDSLS
jgi:threonine aldolase